MKIETDKKLHFLAGYAIALTAAMLLPLWAGVAAAIAAGAAKEMYDHVSKRGVASWADFWATFAGGAAAGLALIFIYSFA